jgi:hypothetical protein
MFTESKTIVDKAPELCDVAATPARIVPVMFKVTLDPGTVVQVTPSEEVEAVKVVPALLTRRYRGTVPVMLAAIAEPVPRVVRYCTTMPLLGVIITS